jgi:hypothetical protein
MRRRQFMTGLAIATLWPVAAPAQQPAVPVSDYPSGWSPGDAQTIMKTDLCGS